eukprot:gene4454-5045_t
MGLSLAKAKSLSGESIVFEDNEENDVDISTRVKVENIHIDGADRTQPSLLTHQLENLFEAKTFNELIDRAYSAKLRLERLGVFNAVEVLIDINRNENASSDGLDVYFFVRESKWLTANAGTHVGNNDGNMMFGARMNNLRGVAENIHLDFSIGTRSSSSNEFSFTKPLFKSPDCKFSTKLYKLSGEFAQCHFKQKCHGVEAVFTVPSLLGIHSFKYNGQWRENYDVNMGAPFVIREQAGHVIKSSVQHTLISDGRDNQLLPTKGNIFKHVMEFSGLGGNVKFVKSEIEIQLNKELMQDWIMGASFQAGAAKSIGGSENLINDKFFLGGPLSVRGFQMKGIGPRVKDIPLGADAFWAAGLHLYTPLPFRPGKGGFGDLFKLHFFANAGNAQNIELHQYNSMAMNKIVTEARWSYGVGIMMMLGGIARLEVNYCIPRNTKTSDGVNQGLQVGVGMNFL